MSHKREAFVALPVTDEPGSDWQIGIAVEGEPGYHPGEWRLSEADAKQKAEEANYRNGIDPATALEIVGSTLWSP